MRQTTPRHATTTAQTAPRPPDDDPIPENIDDFRNALARRIAKFIGNRRGAWRGCPVPRCRRARHCEAPRGACANPPPRRAMTADQDARFRARLHRMVRERCEQIDREEAAQGEKR